MAEKFLSGSIVVGNTTSNPIQVNNFIFAGLTTGSSLTGTTLSFLVSNDGTNYYPLYDNTSTEVTLTVTTAARAYALNPNNFYPWNFIKVREGNSASQVAQASANALFTFVSVTY
jgi:hypothetical protein